MLCLYILAPLLATTLCQAPEEPIDEYESIASEELRILDELSVYLSTRVRDRKPIDKASLSELSGIARRIAYCESGLRNVKNPVSTASGYFQFLDGTWNWITGLGGSAYDYPFSIQLEAFYQLWDGGKGASHWEPSRYCWELEEPWNHYDR